uniref:Saposin B-type domain-containing protein n=1 Tax=Strongyloides papillosus TaxID=174720 RepID=A0A0N5BNC4_STREA
MLFHIFLLYIISTYNVVESELECKSKFELYVSSLLYSSVYEQVTVCDRCATFEGYIKGIEELKGNYSGCLDQLEWVLGKFMEKEPFKTYGICGLSGKGYSLVNEEYQFDEYNVTTTCTPEEISEEKTTETSNRESGPIHAAMTSNNIGREIQITIYMVLSSIFLIITSLYFTTS